MYISVLLKERHRHFLCIFPVIRMFTKPNWNSSFGALAPSLTCISCERQMENPEVWVMSPTRCMADHKSMG